MNVNAASTSLPLRCLLAVPAASPRLFEKAAKGDADGVFLDLEDSVPPDLKSQARTQAIVALNEIDWGHKSVGVRINPLASEWGLRDVIEVASRCGRLDFIVLPRVERAFDVQYMDALLSALEREVGRSTSISINAIIESALGLTHVENIAAVASRLDSLSFGLGDFSISMGSYESLIDGAGEAWSFAMSRIATACKAYGLKAFDGPFTHFGDLVGLHARTTLAARLGFDGKWVIHPSQIATCRDVFSPSEAHVAWAKTTLQALEESVADGAGAIARDGRLLDMAHARLAKDILERARKEQDVT